MMKHKWYKEIQAWSEGAEIEFHTPNGWKTVDAPKWHIDWEYRIKPQPKEKKYLYAYIFNGKAMLTETKAGDAMVAWTGSVASSGKYLGKIEVVQDD